MAVVLVLGVTTEALNSEPARASASVFVESIFDSAKIFCAVLADLLGLFLGFGIFVSLSSLLSIRRRQLLPLFPYRRRSSPALA